MSGNKKIEEGLEHIKAAEKRQVNFLMLFANRNCVSIKYLWQKSFLVSLSSVKKPNKSIMY